MDQDGDKENAYSAESAPDKKAEQSVLPEARDFTATEQALLDIARARLAGAHVAIVAIAATFEHAPSQDLLDGDLLKIHVAAVEALLKLGRTDDAAEKIRRIKATYNAQASVALLEAKTCQLRKDMDGALRAVNEGIVAQTLGGPAARLQSLFQMKAELLIRRGDKLEARGLIKECLKLWKSSALFRLLRQTIVSKEEIFEYENAVLPHISTYGNDMRNALYHYSYLLRDLNDYERAIAVARERFLIVTERYPIGSVLKKTGDGWANNAQIALADLQDDFAASGIDFFLISGTLLGQVRENGLLGHDKDIDVGIGEEVSMAAVHRALENSTRFFVRSIPQTDNSAYIEHSNGVRIDIFRHFMRNNRYYHEGLKVSWWNTPFTLAHAEFLGRRYSVPQNSTLYLEENYGDWRVPNEEFETFVDTPNMEVHNNDYLIWYFMLVLADYFVQGKMRQFQRVWAALSKMYPVDALLAAKVENILANKDEYRRHPAPVMTRRIGRGGSPDGEQGTLPGLDAIKNAERMSVPSVVTTVFRLILRSEPSAETYYEAAGLFTRLKRNPGSALLKWQFKRAALAAGRAKMANRQYLEACQVWYSLRMVAANKGLATRNLSTAALQGARAKEAMGDKKAAFLLWRFLLDAQPDSQVAKQGLVRCA